MQPISFRDYQDLCFELGKYCVLTNVGVAFLDYTPYLLAPVQGSIFAMTAVSWGLMSQKIFHLALPELAEKVDNRDPNLPLVVQGAFTAQLLAVSILTTIYVTRSCCRLVGKKITWSQLVIPAGIDSCVFLGWSHLYELQPDAE